MDDFDPQLTGPAPHEAEAGPRPGPLSGAEIDELAHPGDVELESLMDELVRIGAVVPEALAALGAPAVTNGVAAQASGEAPVMALALAARPAQPTEAATATVPLASLEKLLNHVGELVVLQSVLKEQALANPSPAVRKATNQLAQVTREVQAASMSLNPSGRLAFVSGLTARLGEERFVIPLSQVSESLRPRPGDVHWATGLGELLCLRGELMILHRLTDLLGQKPAATARAGQVDRSIAVVCRVPEGAFAVLVDDLLGQTQVVIRELGAELSHLKGFRGSAILGDGLPALVLDLPRLIENRPPPRKPRLAAV